ncbi:MAG TPA: hypothetical protein VGF28_22045 [Thermoanaerobaculia bacterium]|jgi:hypothetical protein
MRSLFLILALLLATTVAAQTSPILIPIFYNGPGAAGSEWLTRVQVTNRGSVHLEGHGVEFLRRSGCPIPEGCPIGHARRFELSDIEGPESLGGLLLHPLAADADLVEVQGQFGEAHRHAHGIELPIARERDFRTTMFGFPTVITGPGTRTLLRLYSPDPIAGQRVRIILRPSFLPTTSFAQAYEVTLFVPDGTALPLRPAFAQFDLSATSAETRLGSPRVEVVPLETNGRTPRIWGFITITENGTNEVRVMRP